MGRSRELALVAGLAEAAAAGRPWVVWVQGEAGSGKTALVRRCVATLPAGFRVVRAQADELATDIPYELVGQLGAVHTDGPFVAGMDVLRGWSAAQDGGPAARPHPGSPAVRADAAGRAGPDPAPCGGRGSACSPVAGVIGHGPAVGPARRRPGSGRGDGRDQPAVAPADGGSGGRPSRADRAVRASAQHRVRPLGSDRAGPSRRRYRRRQPPTELSNWWVVGTKPGQGPSWWPRD